MSTEDGIGIEDMSFQRVYYVMCALFLADICIAIYIIYSSNTETVTSFKIHYKI